MKASHAILLFAAVLVTQPVALNVAASLYATVGLCSAAEGDQSSAAYRTRAAVHASQGRFQQAIGEMTRWLKLRPDDAEAYQLRGELQFKAGHITASIQDFDRFLELRPERLPHHWQRGISYYYAGQYARGARQFELHHQQVNPQDVENAVWHYLCKAKLEGVAQARTALINITSDRRPWATVAYRMYQGQMTPQQVLAQAGRTEAERRNSLFYTNLYIGLFHEAAGRPQQALEHIQTAVREYASSDYMGDVARVHVLLRKGQDRTVDAAARPGAVEPRRPSASDSGRP